MSTTPARDALRKYVNLLADSWTPRERTDERVEWLYSLVRAEVLRTFTQTEARAEADRHRAAVLLGAADHIEATCPVRSETFPKPCVHCSGPADRLRILACNVEDGKDTSDGGESTRSAAPELTVYRARHDAIVMGLYTTAAAARAHCETAMHREIPGIRLDWIEDEEDGVAELVAAVGEDERSTGYVVEPLTAQAAYDEEADE